jgi:glycosyltransferase involved in cell wall biosynthesis
MSNLAPKVSVVMSVYNGFRYLRQSIESILNQTFTEFEFIIVNDGSTDRSLEVLESYAKQDNRIRLINQQNMGLTKSLNKAIAIARSDLIARMDADDISMPERFERQIEYLENHPECLAVGCEVLQIDRDGAPICKMGIPLSHEEIEAKLLKGNGGVIRHPAVMIRRDALLAIGCYRETFETAQDLDLFLRLGQKGQLANLPDVLLEYRLHLESVNYSEYERQAHDVLAILEDAYKNRGLEVPVKLPPWRFKGTKPIDSHRTWTQMALEAGNVATAKKHAFLALLQKPISRQSWKLLFRTLKP